MYRDSTLLNTEIHKNGMHTDILPDDVENIPLGESCNNWDKHKSLLDNSADTNHAYQNVRFSNFSLLSVDL